MAKRNVAPGISARIEELMTAAKPADLSVRQWLLQANVNTSFLTDMRNGVEPGIDKIERIARRIGLRLSEFVEGGEPPLQFLPNETELTEMLSEAQLEVQAGASLADWPQYVAPALLTRLERFQADRRSAGMVASSARDKVAQPPSPTKPSASA